MVSGQAVANELSSAVDNELSFISTALLIFAAIALFVGAFTIFNTLSITVSQRTRELALLRLVGAGRRQVFRSVVGEAALTGAAASLVGLGLGVLAALGLKALLTAFGSSASAGPPWGSWCSPDREREVLALMAEGRSNHAIAERLFVTDHTVEKARQEHLRLAAPAPVA